MSCTISQVIVQKSNRLGLRGTLNVHASVDTNASFHRGHVLHNRHMRQSPNVSSLIQSGYVELKPLHLTTPARYQTPVDDLDPRSPHARPYLHDLNITSCITT